MGTDRYKPLDGNIQSIKKGSEKYWITVQSDCVQEACTEKLATGAMTPWLTQELQ